jgi:hypothetical protein
MKLLFLGDIVGGPGRDILRQKLPELVQRLDVDLCIANGENASAGSGLTPAVAAKLFALPIQVLTNGDHTYRRREILPLLEEDPRVVRPANMSGRSVGRGHTVVEARNGVLVAVINLIGRVFMDPADCPFAAVDRILESLGRTTPVILVDFHAEATSEKVAMGHYLTGRVSAVIGTHTHVQTADEKILPGGTAYLTDAGMTGSHDSVIGREKAPVLHRFTTSMPARYDLATGDPRVSGVLIEVDETTGRAATIERIVVREEG